MGLTISSALFQGGLRNRLQQTLPPSAQNDALSSLLLQNFETIKTLEPGLKATVIRTYVASLRNVFLLALGETILCVLFTVIMGSHKIPLVSF